MRSPKSIGFFGSRHKLPDQHKGSVMVSFAGLGFRFLWLM